MRHEYFAMMLVLTLAAQSGADEPFFFGIGHVPERHPTSHARGVSSDGSTVVGQVPAGKNPEHNWEAVAWTREEGLVELGWLEDEPELSIAYAASRDGAVIVGESNSDRGHEAFVWTADVGMVGLGDLTHRERELSSVAYSVSPDGKTVVGTACNGSRFVAFSWTAAEGMKGLGALGGRRRFSAAADVSSDAGVIVGVTSSSSHEREAFRWEDGEMIGLGVLPDHDESVAYAVSADGSVVVGLGAREPGDQLAFRWTAETGMVALESRPEQPIATGAFDVSADGRTIIGIGSGEGTYGAIVWDEAHGVRDLRELLTANFGLDLDGWKLSEVAGVSEDGLTFVGRGRNPDGRWEGWIAHIPEPKTASCLLLAVSLARCAFRVARPRTT
jgi:probable HAF family extracellular repeat protein